VLRKIIRTFGIVRHEGATLVSESGPGAQSPVPWDRIPQPHSEWGQGPQADHHRYGTQKPLDF
jgi:hypothetical protein